MNNDKTSQLGKEWNLEDYIDLILRRKYIILAVFVVVFTISLGYSLTRPDIYSAGVTFSTEQNQDGGLGGGMPVYYSYYMQKPIEYYQAIMNSEIPLSIGGGIGQSRTYMYILRKAHLGEVSVTVWPRILKEMCREKNIHVLE